MSAYYGISSGNKLTRHSENDNTPQPLDQWMDNPSIGQQVGNCNSFTLTHYCGPRASPLYAQHVGRMISYRLISLSFHVDCPPPPPPPHSFLGYSCLPPPPPPPPWKSKVKVMDEVKAKSRDVSLTSYRLTSLWFHVHRLSHSWETAFSKIDLEKSKVKVKA